MEQSLATGHSETLRVVGISEMAVSKRREDVLATYSLGSCIGMSLYDPVARVGGLIHCMMPLSKMNPEKAKSKPQMFVDTGVAALLQAVFNLGATRKHLEARVAGAASLLDKKELFKIGERNYTVLRKVLWKNNILIAAEAVGGAASRSMFLHMATGQTILKSGGRKLEL